MADEHLKRQWRQTAELLAMMFNVHVMPRRPKTARDFDPTVKPAPPPLAVGVGELRQHVQGITVRK